MSDTKLLRDQFAMAALQGELASQSVEVGEITNKPESLAANAERCYAIADAMIAASRTPDPRIEAAKGLADALKAVKQEWPHEAPEHCYSTGPCTGDIIADFVACPGCSLQRAITAALAAWEKLQ